MKQEGSSQYTKQFLCTNLTFNWHQSFGYTNLDSDPTWILAVCHMVPTKYWSVVPKTFQSSTSKGLELPNHRRGSGFELGGLTASANPAVSSCWHERCPFWKHKKQVMKFLFLTWNACECGSLCHPRLWHQWDSCRNELCSIDSDGFLISWAVIWPLLDICLIPPGTCLVFLRLGDWYAFLLFILSHGTAAFN